MPRKSLILYSLTPERLFILEQSQSLSIFEKTELLALCIGKKMIAEVGDQFGIMEKAKKDSLHQALTSLELPFFYAQTRSSRGMKSWFQVGSSEYILRTIREYGKTMSEMDKGVLYGFPPTAVQAFSGLRPRYESHIDHPAAYFFGGVYSQDFWESEFAEHLSWWEQITQVSPAIAAQAQEEYTRWRQENSELFRLS